MRGWGVNKQANTNPRETAPELQIHDVVQVELGEALVEILLQHRSVCDEPSSRDENFLKPLPHDILAWVLTIWIHSDQCEMLHQTENTPKKKTKQTIQVKIPHWICDLIYKKGGWHLTEPVIESCCVSNFGPQGLQQLPVEAVPPREGLAVGEQEADRVVPREADVAVRPVGDVFHQPLDADQRGAVDMEGSTCQQDTTSDRWTECRHDIKWHIKDPRPLLHRTRMMWLSHFARLCGQFILL